MIKQLLPPATIGIVGGGQLGQMLTLAAKSMGYKVGVLDPTPDCPAAQVADFQIKADYDDRTAMLQLAKQADVLTYEFENVDLDSLETASQYAALPQGTHLLAVTRNRLTEKKFLKSLGVPVTDFAAVNTLAELKIASTTIGLPSILKTATGGYDGHGQYDVNTSADIATATKLLPGDCILERRQAFIKELAIMVTRDRNQQVRTFPVVENIHQQHILHETIAPAPVTAAIQATVVQIATKIAQGLDLYGVLGIEFFLLSDGRLLVNELAPRPHNSGHFSIEACNLSQFAAHIRSICGLPLPPITQQRPAVMVNLLGQHLEAARQRWLQRPQWYLHDYGKAEIRHQRKMGHITILTDDPVQTQAQLAAEKIWEDQ
ncbi:5-(carboxyamino)imidazole ribonucleotide synthase [Loigolactobacillus zhaoyuanensis]|uniref:N5-carboxyaminoimidazole ribonucleotide synthase n=1 Tax=Loigolactobacillus zhaoyuanensis TaxID=2486017 RepID=A0ABW8UAB2_9LACO|nr:5-(carboxyamino)imidazole ribonucleotide synthase [Loigolactobacillus zhaoyuanensis]